METHGVVYILMVICFMFFIMIRRGTAFFDGRDCLENEVYEGATFYTTQFEAEGQCSNDCINDKGAYWGYVQPKASSSLDCVCCTNDIGEGNCIDFFKFGDCFQGVSVCNNNCKYNANMAHRAFYGYCDKRVDCLCCMRFDSSSYNSLQVEDDGSDIIGPGSIN